jgi:hypothetical protein
VADLRTALRLDEINVFAFGTSSRIAVEAVRSFPHGIRTAVPDSPDLPGLGHPEGAPAHIEDALTAVGHACARANNAPVSVPTSCPYSGRRCAGSTASPRP